MSGMASDEGESPEAYRSEKRDLLRKFSLKKLPHAFSDIMGA